MNRDEKATPSLDHPIFQAVKDEFAGDGLRGTEFRGQAALIVPPARLHAVMTFLKNGRGYNFLSDIGGIDYEGYPSPMPGRFSVYYILVNFETGDRLFVKTFLDPSIPTEGIEEDPALYLDSVTDLYPGAEWPEREVFDMFGIRFNNHPDLRRILTWRDFPAHPLRKDYPLRGRGERERYGIVDRTST